MLSPVPGTAPHEPQPWASVLVVSGSVGAGHDGAANELARRLRAVGVRVDVRDHLQALVPGARPALREGYTLSVGRVPWLFQWLFGVLERNPFWRWLLHQLCRTSERQLLRWTREQPYSLVVSTYPLASLSLGRLRTRGRITVPVVTYLTDPAVHRSWVHPGVDHHWTVTEATARQGRRDYGVPMRAVGPLVPEAFADAAPGRREQVRAALGVADADAVAVIVAGSLGLGDVEASAARVAEAGLVPLVLCGRNEALRERVAAVPGAVALGWRRDVGDLMAASDVLVHNAGGMSLTEALVAGLPAVSYRCIPGHGRANAAVLEAAGLAPWAREDDELAPALQEALARGRHPLAAGDPARAVLSLLVPADGPSQAPAARAARGARGARGARAARVLALRPRRRPHAVLPALRVLRAVLIASALAPLAARRT